MAVDAETRWAVRIFSCTGSCPFVMEFLDDGLGRESINFGFLIDGPVYGKMEFRLVQFLDALLPRRIN